MHKSVAPTPFSKSINTLRVILFTLFVAMFMTANTVPVGAEDLDQGAKKVGRETGTAAHKIGHEVKKAAKTVGHEVKKAAKTVGKAAKDGGKEFKRAVKGKD